MLFGTLQRDHMWKNAVMHWRCIWSLHFEVGAGLMRTQPQPIELFKRGEKTGTILVQLVVHLENAGSPVQSLGSSRKRCKALPRNGGRCWRSNFTSAEASKFLSPVKRIGVSGGTAPFFSLLLKEPCKHSWCCLVMLTYTKWHTETATLCFDLLRRGEGRHALRRLLDWQRPFPCHGRGPVLREVLEAGKKFDRGDADAPGMGSGSVKFFLKLVSYGLSFVSLKP